MWGRNERTEARLRESAAVVEALHTQFSGDTGTFEDLVASDDWAWDVDTWCVELPFGLASVGLTDLAVATADRLADLQPDTASLYAGDAMVILAEAGRAEEARSRAEAAVAAWPDDPWVHVKGGDVHAALDDPDRAEEAYRRAHRGGAGNGRRPLTVLPVVAPLVARATRPRGRSQLGPTGRGSGRREPAARTTRERATPPGSMCETR